MAQKCVHKGCGKPFTDPDEPCVYHPGPPEFHEGQKGWKCCKPRPIDADVPRTGTPLPEPETEDDDPAVPVPAGASCRRRGCGAVSDGSTDGKREGEECRHHPGAPVFHEGSKGWSCCKRRVLEFDQFVKIEGCATKGRHLFVGSGRKKKQAAKANEAVAGGEKGEDGEGEVLEAGSVRNDFYQSAMSLTLSFYLKKVRKPPASTVEFTGEEMKLDLITEDGKRYRETVALFAEVVPEECEVSIRPSKVEMVLKKKEPAAWPGLRQGDASKGEIYQVGKAGRA
ncbi:chord-domain-containing protein [Eremomyces bilateralis CBS 781.70]|uniref:Chord-domain-containing protein n=1 Tax=Eremomyces bilateralis CBS 781.70 TaxID=1392243 RepID=A0A6G1GG17_9PEZI|nr:chord-domain-containing protein [Eremomyces bilateralis CBS 781.70]KAF1816932.1 chord-domain-containing protein [Eremomyces bilateralis CBS 781.70]